MLYLIRGVCKLVVGILLLVKTNGERADTYTRVALDSANQAVLFTTTK